MIDSHAAPRTVRIAPRAFTLIELLIVVGIIAILISLVFTAGNAVIGGGKRRSTENVLRTLDQSMQAYIEEREKDRTAKPIYLAFNPTKTPTSGTGSGPESTMVYVIADARVGAASTDPMIDSMGLWLANARQYPSVRTILDKIPDRFLKQWDPDTNGLDPAGPDVLPTLDTIVDAWGKPIRLVLPQFDGVIVDNGDETTNGVYDLFDATTPLVRSPYQQVDLAPDWTYKYSQIRRSRVDRADALAPSSSLKANTDSDGGRCSTHRPYFYSAGEDNEVGYRTAGTEMRDFNADNVYTERPKFNRKPAP